MTKIKHFALLALLSICTMASAQFSQDHHKAEYMFKAEMGYLPFVSNLGHAGANGYYIEDLQHMANINVINGVNLNQDFFIGLGVGYANVFIPSHLISDPLAGWHDILGFVDFDYRPLDREWSPMFYARAGANYLLSKSTYGNTLTPYFEVGLGMNWFFDYRMVNMERNYRSLYLGIGFAYTQQTTFLPVRLGIRF